MLSRYEPIAPEGSLAWLGQPLPKTVRVNTLKADGKSAQALLAEEGVRCRPAPWHSDALLIESTLEKHSLGNTLAHFLGHIYVQDLASLLPVLALEPHLDLRRFPAHEFPAILLDVPCSSEGTLRKRVHSTRPQRTPQPAALAALQKQLLRKAFALLAPGGTLIYSTCTLAPEENELVVADLLAAEPAARVEPFALERVPLAPGVTDWGRALPAELAQTRRLWPGPQWGGFFLAKIRKEV